MWRNEAKLSKRGTAGRMKGGGSSLHGYVHQLLILKCGLEVDHVGVTTQLLEDIHLAAHVIHGNGELHLKRGNR